MKLSSDPYIILYCSSPRKRENEGSFDLTYGTWGFGLVWLFQPRRRQRESAILLLFITDIAWIKLAFSFWGAYLAAELKACFPRTAAVLQPSPCCNCRYRVQSSSPLLSAKRIYLTLPFPALTIPLKLQIIGIRSINEMHKMK